jgi:delta 1-pyrroline-5-carboxylate dehydrogenase
VSVPPVLHVIERHRDDAEDAIIRELNDTRYDLSPEVGTTWKRWSAAVVHVSSESGAAPVRPRRIRLTQQRDMDS